MERTKGREDICHAKKTEKTQDDEIQGWGGINRGSTP